MSDKPSAPIGTSESAGKTDAGSIRSISSNELLAGQRMIVIRHGKEAYRLQVTSAGKLILTK